MNPERQTREWKNLFQKDRLIWWVLLLALAIRLVVLWRYGLGLSLHSDDAGYTQSAVRLLQLGRLTYHTPNEHTVHMMPGISVLLAGIFAVFGWHSTGIYAAKVVMIIIGCTGIYGIYLVGRRIWNVWAGLIAALLAAFYLPGIETDTLLLTEPPFMASFIFLIYFSIRVAEERRRRDFYLVILFYLICIMFRPTVAMFPVVVVVYLLLKRYPWRMLVKQLAVAAVIVIAVLCPWWIRNYHYYHKFIPLTGGSGDPLLLGTFQGKGYPSEETMHQVLEKIWTVHPTPSAYDMMQYEQQAAKQRMSEWWHNSPASFVHSYAVLKPEILWKDPFYWIPILRVKATLLRHLQPVLVWLGVIGYLASLFLRRRGRAEIGLVFVTLGYYTVLYSIYYVFGRYSEPLMPFLFLGIGAGITTVVAKLRRTPNQPVSSLQR